MSSQYANELGGFKCQSPAGQRCWETQQSENMATWRTSCSRNRGECEEQTGRQVVYSFAEVTMSLSLCCRFQTTSELAANGSVLCPGQDIILYCKFIKETLQYRWCTIQGFIPPPALAAHTGEGVSLTARCRGGQSNRYHYWVSVMVRVLLPSLNVVSTARMKMVIVLWDKIKSMWLKKKWKPCSFYWGGLVRQMGSSWFVWVVISAVCLITGKQAFAESSESWRGWRCFCETFEDAPTPLLPLPLALLWATGGLFIKLPRIE